MAKENTMVYEYCKLFGKSGVPEYGAGVSFADFLDLKHSSDHAVHYHACAKVRLHR